MPGFNLPVSVTPDDGCPSVSCAVDLNPACPEEAMRQYNPNGAIVGCLSACNAGLQADPANSPNCCSGTFDTREACPNSGVEYYAFFKDKCANAYASPFDDGAGSTVIYTCDETQDPGYTIKFCPNGPSSLIALSASGNSTMAKVDPATVSFTPVTSTAAASSTDQTGASAKQLNADSSDGTAGDVRFDLSKLELALSAVLLVFLLAFAALGGYFLQRWHAGRVGGRAVVAADEKQAFSAEWKTGDSRWAAKNPFGRGEHDEMDYE